MKLNYNGPDTSFVDVLVPSCDSIPDQMPITPREYTGIFSNSLSASYVIDDQNNVAFQVQTIGTGGMDLLLFIQIPD